MGATYKTQKPSKSFLRIWTFDGKILTKKTLTHANDNARKKNATKC